MHRLGELILDIETLSGIAGDLHADAKWKRNGVEHIPIEKQERVQDQIDDIRINLDEIESYVKELKILLDESATKVKEDSMACCLNLPTFQSFAEMKASKWMAKFNEAYTTCIKLPGCIPKLGEARDKVVLDIFQKWAQSSLEECRVSSELPLKLATVQDLSSLATLSCKGPITLPPEMHNLLWFKIVDGKKASMWDKKFVYPTKGLVEVEDFEKDNNAACGPGVHLCTVTNLPHWNRICERNGLKDQVVMAMIMRPDTLLKASSNKVRVKGIHVVGSFPIV